MALESSIRGQIAAPSGTAHLLRGLVHRGSELAAAGGRLRPRTLGLRRAAALPMCYAGQEAQPSSKGRHMWRAAHGQDCPPARAPTAARCRSACAARFSLCLYSSSLLTAAGI